MATIRILLADDHVLVREGTKNLLEQDSDLLIVAQAGTGIEAVHQAELTCPDVVLMDVEMGDLDGIEATRQIKAACPGAAVLMLSAYDDDQFVFASLEAGAAGYLLKSTRGHDLREAVRAVHVGESVLSPAVARKVLDRFAQIRGVVASNRDVPDLTHRESEVLRLAARGLSNSDIARDLCVSQRTIQAHMSGIFGKLQVGSRTEAVVRALQIGLLSLDDTL